MDNKRLFVGNIPWQTGEEHLREAFAAFGEIAEVVMPMERRDDGSTRPRGFAFVTFETEEAAAAAIEGMNNHELDGRRLVVNHARPKQDNGGGRGPRSFGNRGGGDRGGFNRGGQRPQRFADSQNSDSYDEAA